MTDLRDEILKLIKGQMKMTILIGEVLEVDKTKDVCVVKPEDSPEHFDVKLRSIVDETTNSRIVVYPAEESKVAIGLIENDPNNTLVLSVSAFESILIELSTTFKLLLSSDGKVTIDSPEIKFNDGTHGGLVKSAKVAEHINYTRSSLNTLKTAMASWVPVPTDGGAALKAAITAWLTSSISTVTAAEFENTQIKH